MINSNGGGNGILTFGALISNSHVITNVQDLNYNEWDVELGCTKWHAPECVISKRTNISIAHFQYNPSTKENDIRLIFLQTPIELSKTVQPIALPAIGSNPIKVDDFGLVSAFNNSVNMYFASYQQVISEMDCQNAFPVVNSTRTFCSADRIVGGIPCSYDERGALFIVRNEAKEHILVGLMSKVPSSCSPYGQPSLYTRISAYRLWIHILAEI